MCWTYMLPLFQPTAYRLCLNEGKNQPTLTHLKFNTGNTYMGIYMYNTAS